MTPRVRVGVIGTSWWAELGYLEGLRDHGGVQLAAICGRDGDRAAGVAAKYAIPRVSTDYRELIAQGGLDALIVAVPDALHYPVVMAALDAKLHVLCEKPLARSVAEARAMYERAEAVGVRHMTHFTYRWFPPFRHLRNLIAEGYVGRQFHADFRYLAGYARQTGYRWRYDRQRGAGALGDLGVHMVDLARWCAGDIARIGAHLATLVPREGADSQPSDPANDAALLAVEFRSGAQGLIQASAIAFLDGQRQEVAIHGEAGTLTATATLESSEIAGARGDERQPHPLSIPDVLWGKLPPGSPLLPFTRHASGARTFIDAILADHPATPSFYDGLKAQEVLEAALISHREGRWVAVGEGPEAEQR
jgi:predicted dehydrogenase